MKKLFFFFAAIFCAASMSAEIIQKEIPLDEATWSKNRSCSVSIDETGMHCTTTGVWGAVGTGWEPFADLSPWSKIVVVVTHMDGCAGEAFKLAVFLQDSDHPGDVDAERYVYLFLDAVDDETNIIEMDLTPERPNCNVSKAYILGIMCERPGAKFTISRVYLEREGEPDPEIDGIEEIHAADIVNRQSSNRKFMIDGDLYILRDGHIFNAQGARVK